MAALINIIAQLLADVVRLVIFRFRPMRSVQAENLFLRRQLALLKERGIKPPRVDAISCYLEDIAAEFNKCGVQE